MKGKYYLLGKIKKMKRGQKMKKIITLLLVLSLAGAMSTTALAAADGTTKSNSTNASSTNTVQITVKASGDVVLQPQLTEVIFMMMKSQVWNSI